MTGLERLKARQAGTAPLPSNSNIIDLLSNPVAVAAHEKDVQQIDLMKLHDFGAHTFLLREDETYKALVASIAETGIRTPLLVRPYPIMGIMGEFEIISGHRRRRAAQQAGLTTVPCIIVQLDDDAATILMAESNIQRPDWLPSEQAKTFAAWLTAVQKKTGISQGQRSDLTSATELQKSDTAPASATSATELQKSDTAPTSATSATELQKLDAAPTGATSATELQKLDAAPTGATSATELQKLDAAPTGATSATELQKLATTRDIAAAKWGISGFTFSMYIKLCDLLPDLLTMVDDGRIAVKAGYQLAFLSHSNQQLIIDYLSNTNKKINPNKALEIRKASENDQLNFDFLGQLFETKKTTGKVTISFTSDVLFNKKTIKTAMNNASVMEKIEAIIKQYAIDHDLPLD